jgi:lysophospholipase L1-like esterase
VSVRRRSLLAVLLLLLPAAALADYPDDPRRKQAEVDAFLRQPPPAPGQVVVTGSSSIRGWRDMEKDLAPTPVIPQGVPGTTMHDLAYYLDELVLRHRPAAAVIYQGDNDVARPGVGIERIVEEFDQVVSRIEAALPEAGIFILSVKPSPARWSLWPKAEELNRRFAARSAERPDLHYVDIATPMLGPDGRPKPDIFGEDGLHMNAAGYRIWTAVIQPILADRR